MNPIQRQTHSATFGALIVGAFLVLMLTGCSFDSAGVGLQVGFGPPVVRGEVALSSPGSGYVWIPGYWDWRNDDYFWVEGSWVLPPHRGSRWVSPRYDHRRGHHYYRQGHWRD